MGSNQSTPTTKVETLPPPKIPSSDESTTTAGLDSSSPTEKITKPKRTGIDAVNHRCRKKKAAYDKCVSKFYNEKFLAGKSMNQEEDCGDLFDTYRQCYLKNLKKEFFDKEKKQVKEGSFLAEEVDE